MAAPGDVPDTSAPPAPAAPAHVDPAAAPADPPAPEEAPAEPPSAAEAAAQPPASAEDAAAPPVADPAGAPAAAAAEGKGLQRSPDTQGLAAGALLQRWAKSALGGGRQQSTTSEASFTSMPSGQQSFAGWDPEGEVTYEGPLEKLGGWGVERKQQRWCELRGSQLLWYRKGDSSPTPGSPTAQARQKGALDGGVDLEAARVIDRGEYLGAHCFSVEGLPAGPMSPRGEKKQQAQTEVFLFARERKDKWAWLEAIKELTDALAAAAGEGPIGPVSPACSPRPLCAALSPVLQYKSPECADCGAPSPTWCVTQPFGVFVCIDCIGVHRALHAGKCKESELDAWGATDVAFFAQRGGNAGANAELERAHPGVGKAPLKPRPSSSRAVREAYIKAKYVDLAFADAKADPSPPPLAAEEAAGSPRARRFGEPPAYSGVVLMEAVRLQGMSSLGFLSGACQAVVTNGFQEVRTEEQRVKGGEVAWPRALQLPCSADCGVFYCTILVAGKIHATAGIPLHRLGDGQTHVLCCPLWGKRVSDLDAQLWVTASYTAFQ
eukprot:TRINITY_DN14033_c0_g1_i1.p1 TRINITY_DN14033_c0_g1~~TRINITY_DN14033_c0_g1_i1.p1  ORF type:complete len:578 (+),score=166.00 TRINITY_DN14033_c0_g1_i1:87-1736(+)